MRLSKRILKRVDSRLVQRINQVDGYIKKKWPPAGKGLRLVLKDRSGLKKKNIC